MKAASGSSSSPRPVAGPRKSRMSPALGRANRSLYHASVLLAGWRRDEERGQLPQAVLSGAYGAGVQLHLQRAYGWFLLSLQGGAQLPDIPPANVSELLAASSDEMDARRGEFTEFRQLENEGWLHSLLYLAPSPTARSNIASLAQDVGSDYDLDTCQRWQDQLEAVIERMVDSMEES